MLIIQKSMELVKNIEATKSGTVVPGGGDRAMLESNLSTPPAHRGELCRFSRTPDVSPCPDGVKAINSGGEAEGEGASPLSLSPSVGLSDLRGINYDKLDMAGVLAEFRKYKNKITNTPGVCLHLKNKSDGSEAIYKSNPRSDCRYFPEGRTAMQRNIRERFKQEQSSGVFLTLTVAASNYDMMEAWEAMWRRFRGFREALNIYRKRKMKAKHSTLYLAALEPHDSGYPHMHVFYPGLRWLIKKQDLHKMEDWWKMGNVRTEKERREESACSYVLKYISKLEGWSELNMALLWYYKLRLYNLSHRYYRKASGPKWERIARYTDIKEISKGLKISNAAAKEIIDSEQRFVYVKSPLLEPRS